MEVTFQLVGINEFRAKIDRLINTYDDDVQKIVLQNAIEIQSNAKAKAKKDTGNLAGSIRVKTENKGLTGVIIVGASYGAYVEFGTRGQVSIPSGYEDLASEFRGAGGGMPPVSALIGWANRHGLAGKEFLIARKIGNKGTKAQPFLIPAYERQKTTFIIDISKAFKKLEGEFNG